VDVLRSSNPDVSALVLVFSRDRAMQLDATLRSFFLHCDDPERAEVTVLYRATTPTHAEQYNELRKRAYAGRKGVRFVREQNFRDDVLSSLLATGSQSWSTRISRFLCRLGPFAGRLTGLWRSSFAHRIVLFLVDDNLFVRRFRLREIQELLSAHADALGLSLRLGRNTTYCYPRNHAQKLPDFGHVGSALKYAWTSGEGDFGYPLEVSSSAYRIADMLPLLAAVGFHNPNTMEEEMSRRRGRYRRARPSLLCFETSVTFCAPVNKVQTDMPNRSDENPELSSESLAKLFASGRRIDVESYAAFVPSGCHEEVALRFTGP
jgi:hypothetical protein